jgi:hypothetical protein
MQRLIRSATQEDLDTCVYIAGVFHEGSQFKDVTTYNPEDAYNFAAATLNNKDRLFLVYEKDSKVVGFFIAGKRPVVWNHEEYVSSEELFYILPEHKSPRVALKFFRIWEKWCKDHGTLFMSFTPTSFVDENVDRWDSFCHAIDFQRGGVYYKKVLKDAD